MDIDFMKSLTKDQMEMMLMDKLPNFSAAFADQILITDFAIPSNNNNDHDVFMNVHPMLFSGGPIHIDPESVKPPKRRNVKISTDSQAWRRATARKG
ncbi:hypothetical protein ACS0TY_011801 [Phlomoides rotata]